MRAALHFRCSRTANMPHVDRCCSASSVSASEPSDSPATKTEQGTIAAVNAAGAAPRSHATAGQPNESNRSGRIEPSSRVAGASRRGHRRRGGGLHRPRLPPGRLRRGRLPGRRDHVARRGARAQRWPRCGGFRGSTTRSRRCSTIPTVEVVDVAVPPAEQPAVIRTDPRAARARSGASWRRSRWR